MADTKTDLPEAVPGSAYMLADHLDAALASGEDIVSAGRRLAASTDKGHLQPQALRTAVELIRALELSLVTRVLKARQWSEKLSKEDARFNLQARLFMGGSAALVDALAQFADATDADFHTGDGVTAYFRSRGVIDRETAALSQAGTGLVSEAFLVAGRIELGPLLDTIASYLDGLEVHFLLFAPLTPSLTATQPAVSADAAPRA